MTFNIGAHKIGGDRVFVIAEIGNNHNGDFDRAIAMIDQVVEMGADCAKFQMRHIDQVYRKKSLTKDGEDLGTEYVIDLLNRFELSVSDQKRLADYCEEKGIMYMCTPWDEVSLGILEEFGVDGYKVASADLTNLPLVDKISATGKPLILSTGMCSNSEVRSTVEILNSRNANFAMLHCNSTYPAPLHDINLNWMDTLKEIHPIVGYSGHERGTSVTLAAVAKGAKIVERHFTLDRSMEGPDHAASLEFDDFKSLIQDIREIEEALGQGGERKLSQGEMINRENLSKSLVSSAPLKKGSVIRAEDVRVRSPGQGLSPQRYPDLVGKTLMRDMPEEAFFFESDVLETRIEPRKYKYTLPWGVPVRYHDFKEYHDRIKPDIFEFHLSYSDMNLKLENYLSETYDCGFVVHAPELFSGSKLMDLATPDREYRAESILETQRVIDITRNLKKYFPKTKRPMIVANIGGFTMDAPLPSEVITSYYETFADSLKQLDMDGVELIPQTMAPFPWHFGGQRYQNLFVKIDEIEQWCKTLNIRMCFDVSHTMLTCNHLGFNFYEFCERIAPFSAHLHLGDAQGLNGEGLQIGEGDIDFKRLGEILKAGCPDASFIPEIWQGHKNGGEGFWIALDQLESYL